MLGTILIRILSLLTGSEQRLHGVRKFRVAAGACEALCTAAEAITSPLLVNAIDANFYDDSSSKMIFWLKQDAGKPVEYSCLVQDGRNVNAGTKGEAKSVAEAITALNEWLAAHDEPLLAVEKPTAAR